MGKLDPGGDPVSPVSHERLIRLFRASAAAGGSADDAHRPPLPPRQRSGSRFSHHLECRGQTTADQGRPASFAGFVAGPCRSCLSTDVFYRHWKNNRPWKTWSPVWRQRATACTCTFNEATLGSSGAAAATSEAH